MTESIGEQLRLAREARGISLREISEQTRISIRYLEAIEQDNYKNLPGGIFNKSFVRAYAKHIGFDEKEALSGYSQLSREMGNDPDDIPLVPHKPMEMYDNARSPLVTLLLTFLILGILSLGAYGLLHWYQRREAAANQPPARPATPAPNANSAAPGPPQNAPVTPVDGSLAVQVKAPGEDVWFRATVDDEEASQITLKAGTTKDYAAKQKVKIEVAKVKAGALEFLVNGHAVKVSPDTTGKNATIVIDRSSPPLAL
ncbi:MAG: RodZ domain-containing protein [Pyrinomonadaceae bacterium]